MVGVLAVSFCDRGAGQESVCLDLWSYPDGTYNLVLENHGDEGKVEVSFPCALYQLIAIKRGTMFVSQNDLGFVEIDRCEDKVCAQFIPFSGPGGFRYCIRFDEYRSAIEALEDNVIGYVA